MSSHPPRPWLTHRTNQRSTSLPPTSHPSSTLLPCLTSPHLTSPSSPSRLPCHSLSRFLFLSPKATVLCFLYTCSRHDSPDTVDTWLVLIWYTLLIRLREYSSDGPTFYFDFITNIKQCCLSCDGFLFFFCLVWVEAFWGQSERMVARVCCFCIELFSPCSLMRRPNMRFTPGICFCSSVPYSWCIPPLSCHVPNIIAVCIGFNI